MKGNIFIDIPKSELPRKIQEIPVFEEKYIHNLRKSIQIIGSLFFNEKIKNELESRLKKLHAYMENIRKAGEFTTRSAGEVLEEYYGLLSFIFCTNEILNSTTFMNCILEPLLFVGITTHKMDIYVKPYSFPMLTTLYTTYAYTNLENQNEKKRLEMEDELFLQNMFLQLFPTNILRYYSMLSRSTTESDILPESSGTYMHFTGILSEHIAEKITEAILYHMQENDETNVSSIVVFVCGPCDKKQILKTATLTETLLEKEECFIHTKLVFIIPEHLPIPDISKEIEKKDSPSGIVSISIRNCNIFCSPSILKEALNNCDILVLGGVSTLLFAQAKPISDMLTLKQIYCSNSFSEKHLQYPQATAKLYTELYGILLTVVTSNVTYQYPEIMLQSPILQTVGKYVYGRDVRAKNAIFLAGSEVVIEKNLLPIMWQDSFTGTFCAAFHADFIKDMPIYANDGTDIIFPLFRFVECVPEAAQFMEQMVEKWNSDNIYINITCNQGVISWNPVITGVKTAECETRVNLSSCNPSFSKTMDKKTLFDNLLLSAYTKNNSCYENFKKSQLSNLLYSNCRSITGLVFCRKLEMEAKLIIMQAKEVCFMERPSMFFFNKEKQLFYDLIHIFDSPSPSLMDEFSILNRTLDKKSLLQKGMQACEMTCYKESALYTNLKSYMLSRQY